MPTTPSEYGGLLVPSQSQVLKVNRVPRSWSFASVLGGVILLIGYLTLAVVFGDSKTDPEVNNTAAVIISLFFIALSHTASVAVAFFQRRRKAFLLKSLFVPLTMARPYTLINLIALFNILLNIFARNLRPLSTLRVVAVGLSSGFTVIYGCAALLIYHGYESTESYRREDGSPLLSDEEMQRRQLARLLEERSVIQSSPETSFSTYRLEIPTLEPVQKTWDRHASSHSGSLSHSRSWSSVSQSVV
ncbi:uncharacterized protein N7483_001541 [Penicillium malachiteum]|uniref:uncharacterized protein n=1 Tax=Penicillium malachiteum TaxID=1324776 RepID=UPI002546E7DF|nr:uncharacterized protein N7483_001541 [Penicillium malachiteum]KAJ5736416.1 hypothetical protein N7483_001541 [Penicillium malachiteum]